MNCPNCAAPITGPICEYCGTIHLKIDIDTYTIDTRELMVQTARLASLGIYTLNDLRKEIRLNVIW